MIARGWFTFVIVALLAASLGISGYTWFLNAQASAQVDSLRSMTQRLQTDTLRLTAEKTQLSIELEVTKRQVASDLAQTTNGLRADLDSAKTLLANAITSQGQAIRAELANQKDSLGTEVESVRSVATNNGSRLRSLSSAVSSFGQETSGLRADLAVAQSELGSVMAELSNLEVVDFNSVYLDVWPSVFRIDTADGTGAGWLLEPGLIVTAEHVISGSSVVLVRQAGGSPFSAEVIGYDTSVDVALLRFNRNTAPLSSAAKPLRLGSLPISDIAKPLMAVGYSGYPGVWAGGEVGSAGANTGSMSQIVDFESLGRNVVMDVPVDPGDSGGPVFNSEGVVVGINRWRQAVTLGGKRVVGMFYALYVDEIKAMLPLLKNGRKR